MTVKAAETGRTVRKTDAVKLTSQELLQALRDQGLDDVEKLTPTMRGESGSAFWAAGRSGTMRIVKVLPAFADGTVDALNALDATVLRLRERGYPAARLLACGQVGGTLFWVQEMLPGKELDSAYGVPQSAALARLLPGLLILNDAQSAAADGGQRLGEVIGTTLAVGGNGYCLHETLDREPQSKELLALLRDIGDRYSADIPDHGDYVHFDFSPSNLLSDGTVITGIVDMNPPVMTGDRAFDLATLLFYTYDHEALREGLKAKLLELAAPGVAAAYMAHMVLRQVEWDLRRQPGTPAARRHQRVARLALDDLVRPLR
jgi:Ser/Thr protein kinase RdoA (MazF antagonist)